MSGNPTRLYFDEYRPLFVLPDRPIIVVFSNGVVIKTWFKLSWSETDTNLFPSAPRGTPPMFGVEVSPDPTFSQPMPTTQLLRSINGMYLARDSVIPTGMFYRLSTAVTNPFILPAATTAATLITSNGATLNGTTTPYGLNTAYWFEYGADTNYGTCTLTNGLTTSTNLTGLSCAISGLAPSTAGHFQLVVMDDDGIQLGGDQTFTTLSNAPPPLPLLATLAATSVSPNSAVLNGTIDGNGSEAVAHFRYGTDTNYSSGEPVFAYFISQYYDVEPFSYTLTNLAPATTYHYQTFGFNCCAEGFGADQTFTTAWAPAPPALLSPGTNTPAGPTLATLTPMFNWSAASQAANSDLIVSQSPYGSGNVVLTEGVGVTSSFQIPGGILQPGTAYAWSMVSFNSLGDESSQASPLYFTTAAAPTVVTLPETNVVGSAYALLAGSVNPNGASTSACFEYGTTTNYGTSTTPTGIGATGQIFSTTVSGLMSDHTYHYRIDATNSIGLSHGLDVTFLAP